MNLTPGTGSENLISRYQTHQLHQDLIRHFGSLEDGLIAMLDQKGDPYTLVRDFAIIDFSQSRTLKIGTLGSERQVPLEK